MAKYHGAIGYAVTAETSPGIWEEVITEHTYYGDIVKNARRLDGSNQLNSNISVSNEISIVADAYANQNFFAIRYAEFMGAKWTVSNVEVKPPRLVLTLGGVYNVQ